LTTAEAALLRSFAQQLADLVDGTPTGSDAAVARLLPDAYRDDDAEAAEFRRLTERDLRDRKKDNAQTVVATLDDALAKGVDSVRFELEHADAIAWLRALADLRLVFASRMGIETNDASTDADPATRGAYDWLAWLQDSLVRSLTKQLP